MRSWLVILLISVFGISCSPETAPPDRNELRMVDQANRIVLAVNESPNENYQNLIQYLSNIGYRMHFRDASSLNLQTAYKPIDAAETNRSFIRIHASVIDSAIHLYGSVTSDKLGDSEIKKPGGKNNLCQKAWQELVEVAEGYPHEELYFTSD